MFKYQVKFAHMNENATDDKERHGEGIIEIETDEEVTTQEHLLEIARSIGTKYGYTQVGIESILQMVKVIEQDDEEAKA